MSSTFIMQSRLSAFMLLASAVAASTTDVVTLTNAVQPQLERWNASLRLSDATFQVTPEVFSAGVVCVRCQGQNGVALKGSIKDVEVSYALKIPLVPKTVSVSVWVNAVKFRLEMLVDAASGKTLFRDFQIPHLGHVSVDVEGLGYLGYVAEAVMNVALLFAHEMVHKAGEAVGRNLLEKSLSRSPNESNS
ncbi:uncharacterized protein LOC144145797 [Haemaphysalis longicornis]